MSMKQQYDRINLPQDAEGPVFEQPWQARAFSLTVELCKTGCFKWDEWVGVFSEEIAAAPARAGESVNDAYYRQWLSALETLLAGSNLAKHGEMTSRVEEWRRAYLNTPHGEPIILANAACPAAHDPDHDHPPTRTPVAVSPATAG